MPLLQESVASILPMTTIQMSILLRSNLDFGARNDAIVIRGVHDLAIDTTAETRKVEGKLDALVNFVTQLAVNQKPASIARVCGILLPMTTIQMSVLLRSNLDFGARNDTIVITGAHDVARDTSSETRNVDGKQDALVNLVTQLAVNQKPASIARATTAAEARHLIEKMVPTPTSFSVRNDAIVIRGVHDVTTDISDETRKVEGKVDTLVNLVTQLVVNQKPASVERVCGIRSSNDHHTNVCPSSFGARNDANVIRGVHEVAIDTSAETRKVEGHHSSRGQTFDREDAFQLLAVSVQEMMSLSLEEFTTWLQIHLLKLESFGARNNVIVIRGVHDVTTDTSAETRKVEGKLDALVNLVTQLAVNMKHASVARVCGIYSTNDHHIDMATDRSAETRKVEGKLDALLNLVTQLAVNQKPASIPRLDAIVNLVSQLAVNQKSASIARVCGIRSSNDQHTNPTTTVEARHLIEKMASNTWQFRCKKDAIVIRGVHNVATDTSAETRKVEGKLDALVNLVTQLAVSQKPASVARVCGIRSSDDHDTHATTAAEARHLIEKIASNF
ncbi:hypothetical protein Fmac_024905 [Flemingia macrophylla]|uniref:Uncharacterized protein n=1 Tax=Flemingia macrophylla TaxID=520843 RepID=A0ABD1LQQ3_9FABA